MSWRCCAKLWQGLQDFRADHLPADHEIVSNRRPDLKVPVCKALATKIGRDHIQSERRVFIMQNIRTFFLAITGFAVLATVVLLTASLTLALGAVLSVALLGRAMSTRLKPVPVRAKARQDDMRVWNDGCGTIIDL